MLNSIIDLNDIRPVSVLICFGCALTMGLLAAFVYSKQNTCSSCCPCRCCNW